jgi:Vacuolar protein sorting-associated protein 62
VALLQQHLGVESIPLSHLSALPTPSPFTETSQYISAETSGSKLLDNLICVPGIDHNPEDHQQWLSIADDVQADETFRTTALETCPKGWLTDAWLSFHRKFGLLLQLCKERLYLSSEVACEGGSPQSEEETLYDDGDPSWQYARPDTKITPNAFEKDENVLSQIPQYVVDYAPLVHLYSGEEYWPCDMGEHLYHITPELNFTPVQAGWQHPRLDNLSGLNRWEYGRHVFLTSDDNVEDHPDWLMGKKNIPVAYSSYTDQVEESVPPQGATNQIQAGRSEAPAVLVVVDKGDGIVDAFWFFFYSFNLGNVVVLRFGNHVGDWEHTVIRFHNGKPKAVFVSEHYFGQAYSYRAVEKVGKRPVVYSATGTHAMYATPGTHSYILPWGLLHDQTDKGPLWDPMLNSHLYTYDLQSDNLRPSNFTPEAPTEWFHFAGHWGDKQYPLGDSRQYLFAGNYHYVSGPSGPKFKNLGRKKICQGGESERCVIKNWLGGSRIRRVPRPFEEEEMSEAERSRFARQNSEY